MQLGAGITARYNFKLEVGQVSSTVEVTAAAANLITESSSSIGQVLDQKSVQDLPLVSNNVLDLMKTMAGVRGQGLGEGTTFAGVTTGMVNTTRDGMSVQEGRYAAGVGSTTLMNPDMVGEMRVILSPGRCRDGPRQRAGADSHQIRHQQTERQRRVVCAQLGAGREHVGQQPSGRQRRVEADPAHVDQSPPGYRERRWSDHPRQDVFLYVV